MLSKFFAKIGIASIWLLLLKNLPFGKVQVGSLDTDLLYLLLSLGIMLYLIEPILRKLTFLLNILTLGLFNIILTVFLLWLTVSLFPTIIFPSLKDMLWGGFLLWALNSFERS